MTKQKKAWSLKLREIEQYGTKITQDVMVGNKWVATLTYEHGFRVYFKTSPNTPPFRETIFSTYGETIRAIDKYINE